MKILEQVFVTHYPSVSEVSKSTIAGNEGKLGVVTITTDLFLLKRSTPTKYLYMLWITMEKYSQKEVWFYVNIKFRMQFKYHIITFWAFRWSGFILGTVLGVIALKPT